MSRGSRLAARVVVAMPLDLDVLATDVDQLFPVDERLWAAPSDLPMLE